jgi:hypothetical protein
MDLTAWALYALIATTALAGAVVHYRRREPSGRGRSVLGLMRGAALALLVLLLFNPVLPTRGATAGRTVVLVDGSLSMRLRSPDGITRWEEARQAVRRLEARRILVFGAGDAVAVASLDEAAPDAIESRLAPTVASALEAGIDRVVVVTDGAIEDVPEVERLVRERGVSLAMVAVGRSTAGNLGLVELDAPQWARSGESAAVGVGVARLGADVPDSVDVVLRWRGTELGRTRVATPPEGRRATGTIGFTPPAGMQGLARLDAALEVEDGEAADDGRSAYVQVADRPSGLVLLSFRPDQEPRFLLPVLQRAVGLPARGWLVLSGGRLVRLGAGRDAGAVDDEGEVRRAMEAASLLVLHGMDAQVQPWVTAAGTGGLLVFPGSGPIPGVPDVRVGEPRAGEWYPEVPAPASPVSPYLTGVSPVLVPPLTGVRSLEPTAGWWSALEARQDRRSEPAPVVVAGQAAGRRVAVALAEGYWRWAFAGGAPRSLYEGLWSGVASWLMERAPGVSQDGVRPEARVVPRGESIRWVVPAGADSLDVRLTPEPAMDPDGDPAQVPVEVVVPVVDGRGTQPAAAPGHYRYDVRARGAGDVATGSGELTVERYSPEFTRPAGPLPEVEAAPSPAEARRAIRPGTPLRVLAWPYLVLIALLCGEWLLRRRWGLR